MRLHGFCTGCRRIKLVSVSSSALVRMQATRSHVPDGKCSTCTQKENCTHTRTNERTGDEQTVRCLDCTSWGRRARNGTLVWT